MKKKLFLIIALFSLCFLAPYKTEAKTIGEATTDELVEKFEECYDFNNFAIVKYSSYLVFYPCNVKDIIYKYSNFYDSSNWTQYAYRYKLSDELESLSSTEVYTKTIPNANFIAASSDVYGNLNGGLDNVLIFEKNYDYNRGGGNISTIVEFPFTREEFMTIPFLIALLICMLFFKWCFPMKGGKKA